MSDFIFAAGFALGLFGVLLAVAAGGAAAQPANVIAIGALVAALAAYTRARK